MSEYDNFELTYEEQLDQNMADMQTSSESEQGRALELYTASEHDGNTTDDDTAGRVPASWVPSGKYPAGMLPAGRFPPHAGRPPVFIDTTPSLEVLQQEDDASGYDADSDSSSSDDSDGDSNSSASVDDDADTDTSSSDDDDADSHSSTSGDDDDHKDSSAPDDDDEASHSSASVEADNNSDGSDDFSSLDPSVSGEEDDSFEPSVSSDDDQTFEPSASIGDDEDVEASASVEQDGDVVQEPAREFDYIYISSDSDPEEEEDVVDAPVVANDVVNNFLDLNHVDSDLSDIDELSSVPQEVPSQAHDTSAQSSALSSAPNDDEASESDEDIPVRHTTVGSRKRKRPAVPSSSEESESSLSSLDLDDFSENDQSGGCPSMNSYIARVLRNDMERRLSNNSGLEDSRRKSKARPRKRARTDATDLAPNKTQTSRL